MRLLTVILLEILLSGNSQGSTDSTEVMILRTSPESMENTHYIKTYDSLLVFDIKACNGDAWLEVVDQPYNNDDRSATNLNVTIPIDSHSKCDEYKQFTLQWTTEQFILTAEGKSPEHISEGGPTLGRTYIYLKSKEDAVWKIERKEGQLYRIFTHDSSQGSQHILTTNTNHFLFEIMAVHMASIKLKDSDDATVVCDIELHSYGDGGMVKDCHGIQVNFSIEIDTTKNPVFHSFWIAWGQGVQFGRGLQVGQRTLFTNDMPGNITLRRITLESVRTTEEQWLLYDANVPGYQGFEGDCNGHDLRYILHSSIQECAASCNDDDVCVGFVYIIKITAIYDCYLKSDTCATPTILYDLELSMYYKEINGTICPDLTIPDSSATNLHGIINKLETITCNDGYAISTDDITAVCQHNGVWTLTPSNPVCESLPDTGIPETHFTKMLDAVIAVDQSVTAFTSDVGRSNVDCCRRCATFTTCMVVSVTKVNGETVCDLFSSLSLPAAPGINQKVYQKIIA